MVGVLLAASLLAPTANILQYLVNVCYLGLVGFLLAYVGKNLRCVGPGG